MISDEEYKRKLEVWESDSDCTPERDFSFTKTPNPWENLYDSTDPMPRNPISRVLRTKQTLKKVVMESLKSEVPRYAASPSPFRVIGKDIRNEPDDFYKQCQNYHGSDDCVRFNSDPAIIITDTRILIFGSDRWHVTKFQTSNWGYYNWRIIVKIPLAEISEVLFKYGGPVGSDRGDLCISYNNTKYCLDRVECGLKIAEFISQKSNLTEDIQINGEVKFETESSHSEYFHLGWVNSEWNPAREKNELNWKYNCISPEEILNKDDLDLTISQIEQKIEETINKAEDVNEQYMGSTAEKSDTEELRQMRRDLISKVGKLKEIYYIIKNKEIELAQKTARKIGDEENSKDERNLVDIQASQRAHKEAKSREPPVEIGEVVKFGIIEFTTHHSGEEHAVGRVEGFTLFTMDVPETKEVNDVIKAKILHFNRNKQSATARYIR